jgi:hypothetical protein
MISEAEKTQGPFATIIRHLALAGRYREYCKVNTTAAADVLRGAEMHSGLAARGLNDWLESVGALSSCRTIR